MFRLSIRKFFFYFAIATSATLLLFRLQFGGGDNPIRNIGQISFFLNKNGGFEMQFEGMRLFCDGGNVVSALRRDNSTEKSAFVNAKSVRGGLRLIFENDVSVEFVILSDGDEKVLSAKTTMPEKFSALKIPCEILRQSEKQRPDFEPFSDEAGNEFLLVENGAESKICFSPNEGPRLFAFSDALSMPGSDGTAFATLAADLQKKFCGNFASSPSNDGKVVAAFCASSLRDGKVNFQNTLGGGFWTMPYFGKTQALFASEKVRVKESLSDLKNLAAACDIQFFSKYADFDVLFMEDAARIAEYAAAFRAIDSQLDDVPLATLAGILKFAVIVRKLNPSSAPTFAAVEKSALSHLQSMIAFDGDGIAFQNFEGALEAALAMHDYGLAAGRQDVAATATILISALDCDSIAFGRNFPSFFPDLQFYPRYEKLRIAASDVTAWTAAKSIAAFRDASGASVLDISFIQGEYEYIVFSGCPRFKSIKIHGIDYHQDSNFERYAASGYIYDAAAKMLYLKLRHKSATERISMFF